MRSINHDVLILVFRCITDKECSGLADWRRQLPLLWVCRAWRMAALPLVYCTLIVESISTTDMLGGSQFSLDIKTDSNTMVLENKGHYHPRVLRIRVHYCKSILPNMDFALRELQNCAWLTENKIELLHVELSAQANSSMVNSFVLDRLDRLQMQARLLLLLVPNVTKLKIESRAVDAFSSLLARSIVNSCGDQVIKMDVNTHSLTMVGGLLPQSLQDLWLFCDSNVLPKINTGLLKRLTLTGVSHGMFWNHWLGSGHVIDFANLEQLAVSVLYQFDVYSGYWLGPCDGFLYTLNAPKLRYLNINASPLTFGLLAAVIRTSRMLELVQISAPENNVITLYKPRLRKSILEAIMAKHWSALVASFAELARDIFHVPKLCLSSHLIISSGNSVADWGCLKQLTVAAKISFDALVGVIERAPDLLKLDAKDVWVGQSPAIAQWAGSEKQAVPISTSLRAISIGLESDSKAMEYLVEKYLNARIESLESLCFY
ncbi:hypothetical protein BX070DRAFT_255656 [Coemansia spiralis]|nr:hypothetical protein BX070DRAFT_255656 [Coemansia spiralis]